MRTLLSTAVVVSLCLPAAAVAQGTGLSPATRQQLTASLNKGAAFIAAQQKPDGKYDNHPGITAMAAAALLKMPGQHDKQLPAASKALDYLKSLAKPDGGIYEQMIPHYITATAVQAIPVIAQQAKQIGHARPRLTVVADDAVARSQAGGIGWPTRWNASPTAAGSTASPTSSG